MKFGGFLKSRIRAKAQLVICMFSLFSVLLVLVLWPLRRTRVADVVSVTDHKDSNSLRESQTSARFYFQAAGIVFVTTDCMREILRPCSGWRIGKKHITSRLDTTRHRTAPHGFPHSRIPGFPRQHFPPTTISPILISCRLCSAETHLQSHVVPTNDFFCRLRFRPITFLHGVHSKANRTPPPTHDLT